MLKSIFIKHNFISRVVLALILFFVAIVLTGVIEKLVPIKKYFPFTGMTLLLLVTWVLYKIDGENLNQLGLNITYKNLLIFLLGLLISVLAFFLATTLKNLVSGQTLRFNESFEIKPLIIGLYYLLPMVFVEELLYRGYLFKKTIEKGGIILANIVFSVIFMLVHVIDNQVLSSLGKIILLAVTIPVGHLLFATALLKSRTLLFPIGLHLGNNWATIHLLSSNQREQSILYTTGSSTFETWPSFITFLVIWNGFYLLLTYLIWTWPENINQRS